MGLPAEGAGVAGGDRRQGERRQGERRGADGLRSNVGWTVAPDRGRGAKRLNGGRGFHMKTSRIIVIIVAVGAAGVAAYLATQLVRPAAPPAPQVVREATAQVLVANQPIGVGQRLSTASLAWQDWPEAALRPDYVTAKATPGAITDMSGSVARSEFLPGDPIRKEKLVQGAAGFLSAVLGNGMRGVSVSVTAESAAGGFIHPNDHVDVVLTRSLPADGLRAATLRSETILHDVQVLAINSQVGNQRSTTQASDRSALNTFVGQAIATLALDPPQSQVIVNAAAVGKLSLLLRSAADVADNNKAADDSANQAIRISSPFWSQ